MQCYPGEAAGAPTALLVTAYAFPAASALLGTVLAFMMAVKGLSFPERVILRRALKPRLLAAFIGVVTLAIDITGYLFNAVL